MAISNERPVLTTDPTDGHRSDTSYVWFQSHLCPSVKSVVENNSAPLKTWKDLLV